MHVVWACQQTWSATPLPDLGHRWPGYNSARLHVVGRAGDQVLAQRLDWHGKDGIHDLAIRLQAAHQGQTHPRHYQQDLHMKMCMGRQTLAPPKT